MNSFQAIIQKYYGQDKIFILNESNKFEYLQYVYKNKYNMQSTVAFHIYFYIMQPFSDNPEDYAFNRVSKFTELNKFLTNIFVTDDMKDELLNEFSKLQKTYYGFSQLAHIYKFKKAKVQVSSDLCMNELNPKKSNVFTLLQNNFKYYFSAQDLINIFKRNLCNCLDFVPEPLVSKNPYNNLVFSDADLYNIYFFLRWSGYVVPELFHGYFMSGFNMTNFKYDYEFGIVNLNIKNYIYNSHHDVLYPIFEEMWASYRHITKKIVIDELFPKDKLMNIMKPYLHLYYTSLYATNGTYKQCNADYVLRRKLMRFRNFNPQFGRRYVRLKRNIFGKRIVTDEFELKHINFYKRMFNEREFNYNSVDPGEIVRTFISLTENLRRNAPQIQTSYSNFSLAGDWRENVSPPNYYENENDTENENDSETNDDESDAPNFVNDIPIFQEEVYEDDDDEEEKETESVS